MTSAVSLSGNLPLLGARTGDRGAKGEDARGQGFADTLAEAVGGRPSKPALPLAPPTQEPRMWLLDPRSDTRIAMPAPKSPPSPDMWRMPAGDDGERQPADPVAGEADGETVIREIAADEDTDGTAAGQAVEDAPVIVREPMRANSAPPADTPAGTEAPADGAAPAGKAERTEASPPETPPRNGEPMPAATRPVVDHIAVGRTEAAPPAARGPDRTAAPAAAPPGDDADTAPRTASPAAETPPRSIPAAGPEPARSGPDAPAATPARGEQQDRQQPGARPAPAEAGQAGHSRPAMPAASAATATTAGEDGQAPQSPPPAEPRARAETPARPAPAPARQMAEQPSDTGGPRVTVIAATTAPAPAPTGAQVLGPTSAGLVSEIAADPAWRSAAQADAALPGARPGPVHSLRIQLQPIGLGTVTARLTQSGAQMSIEIQVESGDARQRLAADSDQIVKALKAAGIEVDKVTIQQAPQATAPTAAQQHAASRDTGSQQQQQASAERGSGGQGERGASGGKGEGTRHGGGETTADRAGGGIYI